jgi:DNA-binding XRE family transcriptional regulator
MLYSPLILTEGDMKDRETRRRGPKERPVPQKNPKDYSAAERMRLTRQKAGKTLSETARELGGYNPRYLSYVETGKMPASLSIARQYEQLFGAKPGKITGTIFERPHNRRNQQEPLKRGE